MFKNILIGFFIAGIICLVAIPKGYAQTDTIKLSVKQAEDRFLKENLQIIAQRYNIDNAEAAVITAKVFPNPDFSFANGIHATGVSDAFNEQSFSISQLVTTAGKRNKGIQLAKISVDQSRYQFFDFLRTLRFSLRSDFYNVYYQRQSAKVYDLEINSLTKMLGAFKEQYAKGNIAEKELLRIQSQLYSLQAEYVSLETSVDTSESDLKMLLHIPANSAVDPQVNDLLTGKDVVANVSYQQLLDSAELNRYDLKNSKITVDYNNMNLQLQKATAVPDLSFSVNYDKLGSYGQNFISAGVGFSLPFFNRNQGAIKQAKIAIDQSKIQLQSQQDQVESDVTTNYKIALRLEKMANSFDPKFKDDFTHLIQEVYKNYEQRNISMLDFLDFYDSYKANTLQINTLQLNRILSLEQLNYVTGTPFFNQQ
jgi:cobalt-zinc-cadmium efflux system outer membrane protein